MKLTDLAIDQFGVWRDLSLDVADSGVTVIHGPNEAGKSTLSRFVSWALYGGDKPFEAGPEGRRAGRLSLRSKSRRVTLRRVAERTTGPGRVELTDDDGGEVSRDWLTNRLEVPQEVFDRVHSIGLHELHELSTLETDDLVDRLYGLSLGDRGRRLTAAAGHARRDRDRLRHAETGDGEVARLLERRRELEAKLSTLSDGGRGGRDAAEELERLTARIADLERRRRDLKDDIRGRRLLERAWSPWNDARQIRAELAALDRGGRVTGEGLARLDRWAEEIREKERRRDAARGEVDVSSQRLGEFGPASEMSASDLDAVTSLRDWSRRVVAERGEAGGRRDGLAATATRVREPLGRKWSAERLGTFDLSAERQNEFRDAAAMWRSATGRLEAFQKNYRKSRKRWARRETALEQDLERRGVGEVETAVADARDRVARVEQLGTLVERDAATRRALADERLRLERVRGRFELPPWVAFVFVLFAVGGAFSLVFGILAFFSDSIYESGVRLIPVVGTHTSVIVGLIYLLAGVAAWAIAYRMKTHYDETISSAVAEIEDEIARHEAESREHAGAIAAVAEELGYELPRTPTRRFGSGVEPIVDAETRAGWADAARTDLTAVEKLLAERDAIAAARRKLSDTRGKLRTLQAETDTVRKGWCDTLRRLGLDETLDVGEAESAWAGVVAAATAERSRAAAAEVADRLSATTRSFGAELDRLAQTRSLPAGDRDRPDETLDVWRRHLDHESERSSRRSELAARLREAERLVADLDREIATLVDRRDAFLLEAGVTDRDEYAAALEGFSRREELEELLEVAESELADASSSEPDLAVVEEDFRRFEPKANAETIRRLSAELDQLEAEIGTAREERGRLEKELATISDDPRRKELEYELGRAEHAFARAVENLAAAEAAVDALEATRGDLETHAQPPLLAAASDYLDRLTAGRYCTIRSPFGERHLDVVSGDGEARAVAALSRGTREQLFLALRFAMIDAFAEEGVKLPVLLDDVFVNFDDGRTRAAVETVAGMTERGRQVIYLTCHRHVAEMFDERGARVLELPRRDRAESETLLAG